jgi:hypothetical protein
MQNVNIYAVIGFIVALLLDFLAIQLILFKNKRWGLVLHIFCMILAFISGFYLL